MNILSINDITQLFSDGYAQSNMLQCMLLRLLATYIIVTSGFSCPAGIQVQEYKLGNVYKTKRYRSNRHIYMQYLLLTHLHLQVNTGVATNQRVNDLASEYHMLRDTQVYFGMHIVACI